MSQEKKDASGQRDTTLARLVAAALESRAATPAAAVCPDAGLLAAYADHTLDAEEIEHWESHFADCARCQKVLAVLTVSAEEPLTQQEVARLGQLVGKAVVPMESMTSASAPAKVTPKIAKPAKHMAPWRWLVPAFGVAAAVVLWFALRPAVPSIALPQQMAQANMPALSGNPSPATNAPAPAARAEAEARPVVRETPTTADTLAKQKDALRDALPKEDEKVTTATEAERVVPAAPMAATPSGVAGAPAAPSSAAAQAEVARREPLPQPPSPIVSGEVSADKAIKSLPFAGRNAMAAMAKAAIASTVFGAPNRDVEWRIGAAGLIEQSTDQGKTWQPQSSGVTADLLSGAAVSDKIAWIVGRANIILRTTDGEHWQRVSPPAATPATGGAGLVARLPDWMSIAATDALQATIASADGRRFATTNGGGTWTPQP